MGEKRGTRGRLFYEFDLEAMVPQDHLLRKIVRCSIFPVSVQSWPRITPTPAGP